MMQIVYISAATRDYTSQGLKLFLAKSRARNRLYHVTGLLLYHSGSILQVLEGPKSGVQRIYDSITQDTRHTNIKIVHSGPVTRREFKEWSMAFIDTSAWPEEVPGKVDYHRDVAKLASSSTAAGRYIRLFQQGLCRQAMYT